MSVSNAAEKRKKMLGDSSRYLELGVSATKADVYGAIESLPVGIDKNTFCKVVEDMTDPSSLYVSLAHADGAGTKSILAYLKHRLTGRLDGFRNIAQDAIVMNLDDVACVGATSGLLLTSIINRNARRIDGTVLREIISAKQRFVELMNEHGVGIQFVGGETADVGDVVKTLLVDACVASRFPRSQLLINQIVPGLTIVGLAAHGPPAIYEKDWNSGIGCNGITLARHELLGGRLRDQFPEICDSAGTQDKLYCGPHNPEDLVPGTSATFLDALLCPTRTYAPIVAKVFATCRKGIRAIVHNTGGAHTKCLRFANNCVIEKDLGTTMPAIFSAIQKASGLASSEMCKVFNLGYRMELYCEPCAAAEVIDIAASFNVSACQIGATVPVSDRDNGTLRVQIGTEAFTIS
jgi:phosphoribosylformylglycinamidine cyclo-ligase